MADQNTKRGRIESRKSHLSDQRENWMTHWRKLSQYILPPRGQFLATKRHPNRGGIMNDQIVDSTATLAARTLSSGLLAGLTSPSRPWFRLTVPDPDLAESKDVRLWLEVVERRMYEVFARSNFYKALPQVYLELGVFGTGALLCEDDYENVVHFRPFTVGSYMLANSSKLRTDSFYREMQMTSAQMVEMFGVDKCSSAVRSEYERGDSDHWHDVVQAIQPNTKPMQGTYKASDKPFVSCWYEVGSDEVDFLRESGFDEFPVMAPKWMVTAEDPYGSSCPGMEAYGDIKALQLEQRRKAEAIDKMVKPPLIGPKALENEYPSLLPGDITYLNVMQGAQKLEPIYTVNPPLRDLKEDIAENQNRIRRAFHEDLFLMLAMSDRRDMTAREVQERHEEKLLMLGPVLEGLIDDLLDPVIDRTFSLMLRDPRTMIPEAPKTIQGQGLKVEYISVLAQAQRAVGISAVERLWGFAGGLAQMNPEVLDKLDFDQTIDEYAAMAGVSPSLVLDDVAVRQKRQQRAKQQQQEQQMMQQREMIEQAKLVSETQPATEEEISDMVGSPV